MKIYSIILGRNSKKSTVDISLIFYNFQRRHFALKVVGKNGCFVESVLHLSSNSPIKIDSQDLLQIGDKKFYLLLIVYNILRGSLPATSITLLHPFCRPLHLPFAWVVLPPPLQHSSKKGRG
uniref:Uncharacterized protein n=1 Tax=Nelumbo nucifera TaxID=4432 RepID=A0A822ZS26_NELNU|nr:TPA_asm: hypothetical protein HUJ06_003966 [Nelumbo nucifera]